VNKNQQRIAAIGARMKARAALVRQLVPVPEAVSRQQPAGGENFWSGGRGGMGKKRPRVVTDAVTGVVSLRYR
jgi:hypothetical protein